MRICFQMMNDLDEEGTASVRNSENEELEEGEADGEQGARELLD